MSVLRSLFPRTYAHEEPEPCPEHGRLSLRGVTWYCDWTRTEMREGRHGFYRHVTRCTYRPGRTRVEVEAEPDLSFLLAKSIEEVERGSPR